MKKQSFPKALTEKTIEKKAVLVCVTDQRFCERLIAFGAQVAQKQDAQLLVLNVLNRGVQAHDLQSSDALEYLFQVSNRYQADMSIFYNADPIRVSNDFISRRNIVHVVTGMPSNDGCFVMNLQQTFPSIQLTIVPPAGMVDICRMEEDKKIVSSSRI